MTFEIKFLTPKAPVYPLPPRPTVQGKHCIPVENDDVPR